MGRSILIIERERRRAFHSSSETGLFSIGVEGLGNIAGNIMEFGNTRGYHWGGGVFLQCEYYSIVIFFLEPFTIPESRWIQITIELGSFEFTERTDPCQNIFKLSLENPRTVTNIPLTIRYYAKITYE